MRGGGLWDQSSPIRKQFGPPSNGSRFLTFRRLASHRNARFSKLEAWPTSFSSNSEDYRGKDSDWRQSCVGGDALLKSKTSRSFFVSMSGV